jgi:hypothetical protein
MGLKDLFTEGSYFNPVGEGPIPSSQEYSGVNVCPDSYQLSRSWTIVSQFLYIFRIFTKRLTPLGRSQQEGKSYCFS